MSNGYDKLIRKYEQYKKDLPDLLEEKILNETAAELEKKVRKRIFTEGLDSGENKITQSYSTKPAIVKQDVFIKPSAFKGKKAMRLEHGYKELREIQGLETQIVNLDYSGDLKQDLKVTRSEKSIVIGITEQHNVVKVQNLEEKYKTKIFAFSQKEIQDHFESVIKKLRKVQRDYFYGR